ncbi:hypothetical protein Tco_0515281 [Tanacetum coccineum]
MRIVGIKSLRDAVWITGAHVCVNTSQAGVNFAVTENMDAYRDEGMGDVTFGEPFLREVGIKTRRFKGMITIYNSDDKVTYQMVRSHPSNYGVLGNISQRCAFWSLNEDILKINDSDYQYAVSIKEDTAYPYLHSLKTTKEISSIRRIQRRPIRRIGDIVCEDSGRYQTWRHFKTLSLDELRLPDFNLLSDQEYSEEEVAKTMAETMEQYMSKTRADYGSGVARPKIEDKDKFELKGQFLKELQTNTFSGSDHKDANEHIEIIDLFHILNITIDEVMLRAFPMSLTRTASCWLRNEPTGSITTWDGLKTKFLNKYCPPARTAKKMKEINNFQKEPDENLYQAWEQFKELLMKCPQHYLTEMQEVILFYNGLGIPTRQILDSRGAIPSKTAVDAKIAIQEMAKYSQKYLGREIKKVNEKVYAAQVGCKQCKGPYYTKDCPLKEERKTLKEAYYIQFGGPFQGGGYRAAALEIGFGRIPSSTKANPRDQVKSISTTIEADLYLICRIGSSQYAVSTGHSHTLMYETRKTTIPFLSCLNGYYYKEKKGSYGPQFPKAYSEASQSIPHKEKDTRSFTLPCFINNVCFDNTLVDLGARVSVMPLSTYLNLGLGELAHTKLTVELADMTMKYPKGIAENVLVGIARLMGETLVFNRSLDPFLEDYIELNDLNEPFGLKRNQGDDLMPTIEEGEVIEEFRTRDDELNVGIDDYPSYCDYDKKTHIDYAHNLKFSCMIGFEFTHANFFPLLYVNVMHKGNNVVGALMNISIFVEKIYVMTNFVVLENIDAYRDEGMGDVIFGEPFLKEVGIMEKRFEGIITIYNSDDEVTYQMLRSHLRFKFHTNEKCNKIPPLLKVSEKDEMNGISHAYQKLKGFYKGVLNLGPDYIRNAKTEEWLTRGHISVHEME